MQTRKEFECGVMLGKTYWKVLKIVVNKVSKDTYVILPIPDAGLHWSIHSPKPPTFPNWHIHVRSSRELGIEEEADLELSSISSSLGNFVDGFMDAFRICSPTDEEILVMSPNFLNCFEGWEMNDGKKTIVDIGQLIRATSTGTFYRTRAKHLPRLLREIRRKNPSFGKDVNIFGVSNDKMVIPISSKRMLEFEYRQLTDKLNNMHPIGAFFDPMERAIERLKVIRPNVFQEWFPNDFTRGLDNFIEPLESSKPRFVDFP